MRFVSLAYLKQEKIGFAALNDILRANVQSLYLPTNI
jgi:hypothetical protein